MPQYISSKKCFFGGALREEGVSFPHPKIKKDDLPSYFEEVSEVKLTPQQRAAATKAANKAKKAAEAAAADIAAATNTAPKLPGAGPVEKTADTVKPAAVQAEVQTLS